MDKKIGIFLMIMLVMCSVLLLMATAGRNPEPQREAAASTAVSEPAASESAEPTESMPETEPAAEQTSAAVERVRLILEREDPDRTAVTSMAGSMLQLETDAGGQRQLSYANALAELARERKMNPIAGFWELVSEGLYSKEKDETGTFYSETMEAPAQEKKQYAYTAEGARQMLTDLLALSGRMDDDLALELALLGANGSLEMDQVHFAEDEECRYAYFACASEQSTHILCFYLRTDGTGEWITDVEFQLLNMRHASADEMTLAELSGGFDRQTAALMAAAELLMTGQTRAAEGNIPFAYEIGGCDATIGRFRFTGNAEQGTLTNYRLKIG